MNYEGPPPLSHYEIDALLSAALRGEHTEPDANSVLVGLVVLEIETTQTEACARALAHRLVTGTLEGEVLILSAVSSC